MNFIEKIFGNKGTKNLDDYVTQIVKEEEARGK